MCKDDKLKPCPFCGSPAKLTLEDEEWAVNCINPEPCYGKAAVGGTYGFEFKGNAVRYWNKRLVHEAQFCLDPEQVEKIVARVAARIIARGVVNSILHHEGCGGLGIVPNSNDQPTGVMGASACPGCPDCTPSKPNEEQLTDYEIKVLRVANGEHVEAFSWGAAVTAALEHLAELDYVRKTSSGTYVATEKGQEILAKIECIFNQCEIPEECKNNNQCQHVGKKT